MDDGNNDHKWFIEQLQTFVLEAQPTLVKPEPPLPGLVVLGDHYYEPAFGRQKALNRSEGIIKPILDKLYPDWREENPPSDSFEFESEYSAAERLVAQLQHKEETERQLAKIDMSPKIQASGMHPLIWKAAKTQWNQGNHHQAVNAVARKVNTMLQDKVDRTDVSEVDLVNQAFSDKDPEPGKPRLRFDLGGSDDTNDSFRRGAMQFGSGLFSAVRNPLSHLDDDQIDMDEAEALESLAAFSLFARWADRATVEKATP